MPKSKQQEPVYNEAGTHIYVQNAETGDEWECPPDYLKVALAHGFELSEPRDRSLDGLFDDQTGFNPAEHTFAEVNEHLAAHAHSSPGEVDRVLELERAGQNRKSVVDPRLPVDEPTDTGD